MVRVLVVLYLMVAAVAAGYANKKFQCPDYLGLPLGDINLIVVTDIHGWIAGQHARHEGNINVDFGALLSLYQRLQECAPQQDFFLLFNGDFMDGTGLSTVPPEHLAPLLQRMPFDALNVGNHELYFNQVVDYMMRKKGFVDFWKGNYLASNVDYYSPGISPTHQIEAVTSSWVPFGSRYTFLHGSNRNSTILTFGFLYNFQDNCNHTRVQNVEDTLREAWFVQVVTQETYNAILVLGHFDAVDPLVYTILNAIRTLVGPYMPIHFLTGHTHRRHYQQLDPLAASLEAGKFMDTIGFASFPLVETANAHYHSEKTSLYQHKMLNANFGELTTNVLKSSTPDQDFSTRQGRALTNEMQRIQEKLGLLEVVTRCAPQDYYLQKPLNDKSSLWWLYVNQVVPSTLFAILKEESNAHDANNGATPIFIQGTGALRYSLLGPVVVVDDIIAVSPFENLVFQIGANLTAHQLNQVFETMQVDGPAPAWGLVNFGVAGERPGPTTTSIDSTKRYDLYTVEFHLEQVLAAVKQALSDTGYSNVADSLVAKPVYRPEMGTDYHHLHFRERKREPLDATDFWFHFVRNEWRCPDGRLDDHKGDKQWLLMISNSPTSESIPSEMATLAAVFLILLYAFASVRRQKTATPQRSEVALQLTERPSRVTGESTPLLLSQQ
jgi:Calcineurin-like phosphoesterase